MSQQIKKEVLQLDALPDDDGVWSDDDVQPTSAQNIGDVPSIGPFKAFCKGWPKNVTQEGKSVPLSDVYVFNWFGKFDICSIDDIHVAKPKNPESMTVNAGVTFSNRDGLIAALSLTGQTCEGNPITITLDRPLESRYERGSGYGSGPGGYQPPRSRRDELMPVITRSNMGQPVPIRNPNPTSGPTEERMPRRPEGPTSWGAPRSPVYGSGYSRQSPPQDRERQPNRPNLWRRDQPLQSPAEMREQPAVSGDAPQEHQNVAASAPAPEQPPRRPREPRGNIFGQSKPVSIDYLAVEVQQPEPVQPAPRQAPHYRNHEQQERPYRQAQPRGYQQGQQPRQQNGAPGPRYEGRSRQTNYAAAEGLSAWRRGEKQADPPAHPTRYNSRGPNPRSGYAPAPPVTQSDAPVEAAAATSSSKEPVQQEQQQPQQQAEGVQNAE